MPEAAEVAVLRDGLEGKLLNRKITMLSRFAERSWVVDKDILNILNDKIVSVDRIGKFIILSHESTRKTLIHLSFTGSFSNEPKEFLALKFKLDDGSSLYYSDRRGLSKIRNLSAEELKQNKTLSAHKVDGLSSSVDTIYATLKGISSNKELKPFLLDYHNICGIGNIYGSEICHEIRVSPKKKFNDLNDEQLHALAAAIKSVLEGAYTAGGSSIEDFVTLNGEKGHAQDYHKVYHKSICPDCGSRILSIKQDNRATFYCPKCQKE